MMKTITSHWFNMLWTTLVVIGSACISLYTQDASHLARAGALVTLAGIIMTTRRILVNSSEKQGIIGKQHDSDILKNEISQALQLAEEEQHLKAEKCGFWFLIVGTVIWAYGDLAFSALLGWS